MSQKIKEKNISEQIKNYNPFNEQEKRDKEQILFLLSKFEDVLTRKNTICHFSSSAFVVNKERTKMLAVNHKIYNSWVYPGGHADGENNLLSVALREVEEETGLKATVLNNNIFSLQTIAVNSHIKNNKYISSHLHLDVIYLMEADDKSPLVYRKNESNGAKWISFENATGEGINYYIKPIHKKLIEKLMNT